MSTVPKFDERISQADAGCARFPLSSRRLRLIPTYESRPWDSSSLLSDLIFNPEGRAAIHNRLSYTFSVFVCGSIIRWSLRSPAILAAHNTASGLSTFHELSTLSFTIHSIVIMDYSRDLRYRSNASRTACEREVILPFSINSSSLSNVFTGNVTVTFAIR